MYPDALESVSLCVYEWQAVGMGDSKVKGQDIIVQGAKALNIVRICIRVLTGYGQAIAGDTHQPVHIIDKKNTIGHIRQLQCKGASRAGNNSR